jgi:thymidylate kinase
MIDNQDMIKSNDMIILDRYVHSLEAYGGVYIDPRDERI